MTKSERIRELASQGVPTAEIARRLGIRYQHAYNVLAATKPSFYAMPAAHKADTPNQIPSGPRGAEKPSLGVDVLVAAGFSFAGRWALSSSGALAPDQPISKGMGVYAYAKGGTVLYVGLATMGLAKRLYYYGKPGPSQMTNLRLNGAIKRELEAGDVIDIYTAEPPDSEWNGLPVHGAAGLEMGLIRKYALPWNLRSSGSGVNSASLDLPDLADVAL
ncbi:GIY-YIG nuclease family protein [Kaistia adipata]|uniref:GIY-YIG nuclease family protein n=1 Tax=Kaistia adipata TaxID=166954 RepID=UPI001FE0007A|nr:GIY-YIG nuclease family protein [Kaistia adipata]